MITIQIAVMQSLTLTKFVLLVTTQNRMGKGGRGGDD